MREMTFVDAAREGLAEEMERDPRIFVVGEGIGARGGNFNTTVGLHERYGDERLRDTPISERGFTALCTGAAASGARPVVDFMFVDFLTDAFGDMFNQMSKLQLIGEFARFVGKRKRYWVVPLVMLLLLFGVLIVFAEGSALAPFIYTLF